MRIEIGFPDKSAERELLLGEERRDLLEQLDAALDPEQLLNHQAKAEKMHCSDAILDYLQDILHYSRNSSRILNGLSPRAGIAILRAAKAYAYVDAASMVLPEHIQAILPSVIGHRLKSHELEQSAHEDISRHLIEQVPIP